MKTETARPAKLTILLASACVLLPTSAAIAETPEEMMAHCRNRAHKQLNMRLPDIETKYEGQRTDGTHAVNGTARNDARTVTFQCSFNKRGRKIVDFVVNKPSAAPAKPMPSKAESDCLAAVAKEVSNGDVSTISVEMGETSTHVLVKVPGAQKPWRCDHDGRKVLRVMYMGEG